MQVADTTQAMPSSSTSVTPASTMTGHSQTPVLTTPLSYQGAPTPLTQLTVGVAVRAVDLEVSRQAWLGLMKDRVNKLLNTSTVLCQEYSDIVKTHSGEMEVAHTNTLCDMNKYSAALHVAIGEWRVDIERVVQLLGASPGITTFNTQAEIVRVKTNQFREKVDGTEVAFLTSKKKTEAGRAALLKQMKTELGAKVHAAIQKFVSSKMMAALDVVGPTGDMAPFVAQITHECTNFWTRIAQVKMEYLEYRMHLQTASVMQQLDMLTMMSRLIPLMCHLMYPVPSQQPSLMPAPGTRANVTRIGPDVQKRAPPPDNTERGKLAKVMKVPKSEIVIISDTPSPLSSPTAWPSTGTVSSSNGGDGDTMLSTTPVKKTCKPKKKKKSKDSAGDVPSRSEDAKAAEKAEAERKAKIKEEGKQNAMQKDYPIIKTLWVELGLPFDRVNQFDMTLHMQRINTWRQANKDKGDWRGMFITLTVSVHAAYVRDLNNPMLKLATKPSPITRMPSLKLMTSRQSR